MTIKTNTELVRKLKDIADNKKTVYAYGVFGSKLNESIINNKAKQYPDFYTAKKRAELIGYANKGYFGFDCVNLIKGVLWGWNGSDSTNGGAKYATNGVPDINADTMISKCKNISSDFSDIEIGEVVWRKGHIGVYIGNGLAVECTPKWENSVQITAVANIGFKSGYNARRWTKHGRLPYISYSNKTAVNGTKNSTGGIAVKYFAKPNYNGTSLVDGLNKINASTSYNYRKKIAKSNNIDNYTGTATQNTKLLNLLKRGKLIKP